MKKHYINIQESLYSNQEIKLNDKLVLGYILSIYVNTNIFYMSDYKLAENLGTSKKIIRGSIKRLNDYNWFNIKTKSNINKDSYGGKTREITINVEVLDRFLQVETKGINTKSKGIEKTPSDELKINNQINDDMKIKTDSEIEEAVELELKEKDKALNNMLKTIAPNITEDDYNYYDVKKVVKALIKTEYSRDDVNSLKDIYNETESDIDLMRFVNSI